MVKKTEGKSAPSLCGGGGNEPSVQLLELNYYSTMLENETKKKLILSPNELNIRLETVQWLFVLL